LYLPLHGEHQARNAALALATVELFLGASDTGESPRKLNEDTVRAGLASVTSPARLERVRTSPTVVIDSAHNPHGATAVATALSESFDMRPTIAVVAVVEGKDAYGLLSALEPAVDTVVVTRNSSPRSMTVDDLAEFARAVFGDERVLTSPDIAHATETAIELADQPEHVGSAGVVALGSVVTAADVRRLLRPAETVAPGVTMVAPSADNVELDEDGFEIDSFPQGPRIGDRP
ncbi:MAG: cyanophycin synthetase, partial [Candidatus Nanopelagicales bacterium]